MTFDKNKLPSAQLKVYEQLVADLKAAPTHTERQAARIVAMIPGPGDLLYVPGAMAAAEAEAGIWTSDDSPRASASSAPQVAGEILYNPFDINSPGKES